ncbi:MAG: hypothetical protein IKZ76_07010 [Lachnospiraceae bacterium]|nr:hypothetical protein [Lachnospiraceae bacterium]
MKLSEILLSNVRPYWDEASDKDFVVQMAKGLLNLECFKNYMIQDYLYLFDYIEILKDIKAISNNDVSDFLDATINVVEEELKLVHIPNMEKLGINVDVIKKSDQNEVFSEYVSYMKSCVRESGMTAGLIALLQCSWCYAYIAGKVSEKYADEISVSSYREWFEAYTGKAYNDANQTWIDIADKECMNIDKTEIEKMVEIFKECAGYENKIWDEMIK